MSSKHSTLSTVDPRVTVVVAAYKQVSYLREALVAVLRQTYKDFEVIISDDSYCREIERLVASFNDSRIIYRCNNRNLGIAQNHRVAYAVARGEYIANLNHDDFWAPEFLEELVARLDSRPDVVIAFSEFTIVNSLSEVLAERTAAEPVLAERSGLREGVYPIQRFLIGGGMPLAMAAVFRSSMLKVMQFPRAVGGAYDAWLALMAYQTGGCAYYVPRRLSYYRVHPESATDTRQFKNLREGIFVTRHIFDALCGTCKLEKISNRLCRMASRYGAHLLIVGRFRRAKPYIMLSVAHIKGPRSAMSVLARLFFSVVKSASCREGVGYV